MYKLMKKGAIILMFIAFGFSGISLAAAQPEIELLFDPQPDSDTVTLDSGLSEIWVEARVSDRSMSMEWSLEGPGDFQPIDGGFGGIYTLPDAIETASATITISASGTNPQGVSANQTLELTLTAPAPAPTPTPLPTPTPTPTPLPVNIQQVFLHHSRFYVTQGETVGIVVALDNPSDVPIEISCNALKGQAECLDEPVHPFLEVRYTAPDAPGKDMLEVQIHETENANTERALVKIDVLPK